ncbi:hypothetical protein GNF18_10245 [Ligilactobacillus pobuzihii]|uniref:hypothetical protein n=1 Tax=Ligilactobacillus pobuzihii TaxID=449659 RepID=UPI0019CFF205|nr:hypothetical protein [Ligilactobacillus pobuzihii]MBN7275520.1 hypothetical protein [Ligilactobacillus pobuzihii]
MKMQKYVRRSVEVKAIRFDIKKAERNCLYYYPMVQDMYDLTSAKLPDHRAGERFYLKDIHHSSVIHDGDYIVQGNNGQFYIVDKGAFESNYNQCEEKIYGKEKPIA